MTFIHNAGLGELLDRLSIVTRKIVELWFHGGPPRELVEEASALVKHIVKVQDGRSEDGSRLYDAYLLAAVNGALWERENIVRLAVGGQVADATVSTQIVVLNNRRRQLVAKLSGRESDPKIYRKIIPIPPGR